MDEILGERKRKFFEYLKKEPTILISVVLALIAWFGYYVRTLGLSFLVDITTGKYIPSDPDAIGFLRYVKYIVENGSLMSIDYMRYYPTGFTGLDEFSLLSHLVVYFYKILHLFSASVTVEYAHVIYPPVAFVIALVFFFLLVRKVFDWKVALLASAFLAVVPAYLFRTQAGVSDKEAMAMVFMYLGLFLFISFILEKDWRKSLAYSILGGLATGCLWWIWGGVTFVLVTIGLFMFVLVLIEKLSPRNLGYYAIFLFFTWLVLLLGFPSKAEIGTLLTSTTTAVFFFALLLGVVHYLLFHKDLLKIKDKVKIPNIIVSFGLVVGAAVIILVIVYGPSFIFDKLKDVYIDLVRPFSRNRWALTVAESQQPYFTDWLSQFSLRYLIIVFVGAVLMFYELFKSLGKKAYYITSAYALFILAFALNRYSSSAEIFNGASNLSIFLYLGSLVAFGIYLLYFIYDLKTKHKELYNDWLHNLNLGYIFISIFFVCLMIGARSAQRLLFVFAPVTAILAAYFVFIIIEYSFKLKDKNIKYVAWLVVGILAILILYGFAQSVISQASNSGNSFNQQWQYAMDWVRENTPTDAVFAHWWDYGYFVQSMGERATVSDGGNAVNGVNHLLGRHFLLGANDTEALEFLKAKNVSYTLVVSDEVGKYSAFASIGSDADYDRYSWIPVFSYDTSQTQETRDGTNIVYVGGTMLDEDFTYNGILFPASSAGIGGFMVPAVIDNTSVTFSQPTAVIVYNDQYYNVPVKCVYFNGQEIQYSESGLESCLMIIPSYSGSELNDLGAAMYLSNRVVNTWFAQHYLFGNDNENFELVYSDEQSVPLMLYYGRIIGPIKIWKVTYPDDLVIPEEYYTNTIDSSVDVVR